ncbi:MAG: DUF4292 domain-containing protein [Paramuribaculum sp.]|nr:DUF4292 domain-containing protein [Paramuribaculum sp.]
MNSVVTSYAARILPARTVRSVAGCVLAGLLAAGMNSCGSHKQTVVADQSYESIERTISGGSYAERFASILQADDQWTRVKLPVTFGLETPARFSVTGTAQIERGESVFVSFRMLGFEVAQLFVTDDRIVLIDKYHRKYVEESTSKLLNGVNVTVDDLQSLLLGQPFVAGVAGEELSRAIKAIDIEEIDDNWDVSLSTDIGVDYGFMFNSNNNLGYFSAGFDNTIPFFVCEYSSPVSHGESLFASGARFTVRTGNDPNKNFVGSVTWNFDKASWDDNVEPRKVSTPSGYDRVTAAELLQLFAK